MRIEKEGFVLHLEGTWCEISNKYAVLESGDVAVNEEDIPAGFAEKKLDRYIETHKIRGYGKVDGCTERKELIDKWIRVRYIWKYRSSLAKMFR